MSVKDTLFQSVVELEESKVYNLVKQLVEDGTDPKEIIDILRKAVEVIGEKFSKKEYFLTELVMAGEIFKQSAIILEPALEEDAIKEKSKGVIVVGTVKGDVHDIGKNIFITLLKSAGFEVYDLGVDIPSQNFVKKVKETNARVVGYSGLLTVALEAMKETTEALKSEGLRDKVKIIIGGLPTDEMWMKEAGADAYTDNAFEGVKIVKKWIEGG
ncbi:MAG: B12-binding domain-containing protein [Candidatus Thorarchaeota archaeon]